MNYELVLEELTQERYSQFDYAVNASGVVEYCLQRMEAPPTFVSIVFDDTAKQYYISLET